MQKQFYFKQISLALVLSLVLFDPSIGIFAANFSCGKTLQLKEASGIETKEGHWKSCKEVNS